MKRFLFSIIFIFLPILIEKIIFPNGFYVESTKITLAGIQVLFYEMFMVIYLLAKNDSPSDRYMTTALLFLFIAELIYVVVIFNKVLPSPIPKIPGSVSSVFYMLFIITLIKYLLFTIKTNYIEISIITIVSFSVLYFDYIFIEINYSNKVYYFLIFTLIYAFFEYFLLATTLFKSIRENDIYSYFILFSISLLCISDIAIRYQYAIKTNPKSYYHFWQIAISIIFVIYIVYQKNTKDTLCEQSIAPLLSIRSFAPFLIVITFVLFGLFMLMLNYYNIITIFDFSNILLCVFGIFSLSNIVSLFISNSIIKKYNLLSDRSEINVPVTKATQSLLFEIDHVIKNYNNLTDKTNKLIKQVTENMELAEIGKMTAIITHDIKAPLNALKMMFEMDQDIWFKNPLSFTKAKRDIESTLSFVNRSIEDISTLSRNLKLNIEPTSLSFIVNDILKQLTCDLKKYNIDVKCKFKTSKKLWCDSKYITNALFNIIKNAIEAIGEIGKKSNGKIWISTKLENDLYKIIIGNSGPHIEKDFIIVMYDYFETKSKEKGVGVGLASVKKIIDAHNGRIECRNTFDGVEFIITLHDYDAFELHQVNFNRFKTIISG